jgi:hypothetical protein
MRTVSFSILLALLALSCMPARGELDAGRVYTIAITGGG